jgi:hypothetical protein
MQQGSRLMGHCHEIFIFINHRHLGLWISERSRFEYGFDVITIVDEKQISAEMVSTKGSKYALMVP